MDSQTSPVCIVLISSLRLEDMAASQHQSRSAASCSSGAVPVGSFAAMSLAMISDRHDARVTSCSCWAQQIAWGQAHFTHCTSSLTATFLASFGPSAPMPRSAAQQPGPHPAAQGQGRHRGAGPQHAAGCSPSFRTLLQGMRSSLGDSAFGQPARSCSHFA